MLILNPPPGNALRNHTCERGTGNAAREAHSLDTPASARSRRAEAGEIETILDTADGFVEVSQRRRKKVAALTGKVVVNLFFEPSTRTRTSFGLAARRPRRRHHRLLRQRLQPQQGRDVHRHGQEHRGDGRRRHGRPPPHARRAAPAGPAPRLLASSTPATGPHEHPTQGLLDILTIRAAQGPARGADGRPGRRHRPQPRRLAATSGA